MKFLFSILLLLPLSSEAAALIKPRLTSPVIVPLLKPLVLKSPIWFLPKSSPLALLSLYTYHQHATRWG